jgi:hypothetical protein
MTPQDAGRAVVMAAATARLTRLVTDDEIARPIRDAVMAWAEKPGAGGLRKRAGYLVDCPWCVSMWAGGAVLFASRFKSGRWLTKAGALSMAAAMLLTVQAKIDEVSES